MTLTYTLMFAVALAFVNIWLAVRVSLVRMKGNVSIGDGGNMLLATRMRAHANFIEYVPMALILMALVELRVGPERLLFWLGLALVLARLLHAFGMERPAPNPLRAAGIVLTLAVTSALAIWGALLLYGVVG